METIKQIYPKVQQSLKEMLMTPPLISNLRVNTLSISPEDAINQLQLLYPEFTIEKSDLPDVINIRSKGPFELDPLQFQELIQNQKFVLVDDKCGESVLRGSQVYAPGVMGTGKFCKQNDFVAVIYVKNLTVKKGTKIAYEDIKERSSDIIHLANGILIKSRKLILKENEGVAVQIQDLKWKAPSFFSLPTNLFFAENYPSCLVAHMLAPSEEDFILDMCAAPGGKTCHIATLMKNKGQVIACDKSKSKVSRLDKNVQRFNLANVSVLKQDSTKYSVLLEKFQRKFDKILLDPPCSALGLKPRLQMENEVDIQNFASYQKRFIQSAKELLKPQGTLIYSTCTVSFQENEENVQYAESLGFQIIKQIRFDLDNLNSIGFFICKLILNNDS